MKKTYFCILLSAFFFTHPACHSVKKMINKKFPPLTVIDQQMKAIEQNLYSIDSLDPSIGVFLHKQLINTILPDKIQKTVEELKDSNLLIHKFIPTLYFEKQAIVIKSDFHFSLPQEGIDIKGNMIGFSAVSVVGDSLFLHNSLRTLKIKSIKCSKKISLKKRALVRLVRPVLRNFLNNINGIFFKKPAVINIGWKETLTFDPKEMFKGRGTEISGNTTEAVRFLTQTVVLINQKGVSVLLELDTQPQISHIEEIGVQTTTYKKTDLKKKFEQLQKKYNEKWDINFSSVADTADMLVAISKSEIAGILNELLASGFTLKQKIELPKTVLKEKMGIKESDIDCNRAHTKFSYPKFKRRNCSRGCEWWNIDCKRLETQCNLAEEARRTAYNGNRESARVLHQANNEASIAACKLFKETNNIFGVGTFKAKITANGLGEMVFSRFECSPDLSHVNMRHSGSITISMRSQLNLHPVDFGHFFLCFKNYSKSIKSNLNVNLKQQSSEIQIQSLQKGENLYLMVSIDPIRYTATVNPSPLQKLISDVRFRGDCPFFSGLLKATTTTASAAKFLGFIDLDESSELLLMGKARGKYQNTPMQKVFSPMTFNLDNTAKIRSFISWEAKSIQFSGTIKQ